MELPPSLDPVVATYEAALEYVAARLAMRRGLHS